MREELQRIQVDQQTGSAQTPAHAQSQAASAAASTPEVDVSDLSRDAAERLLVECLTSKQFSRALSLMKNLRLKNQTVVRNSGEKETDPPVL